MRRVLKYMCICLWQFHCPEVTLCGWQDVKIQLLTDLRTDNWCDKEWCVDRWLVWWQMPDVVTYAWCDDRWLSWQMTIWGTTNVTRSHKISLNLKFGSLRYLHVSNLQVLLVILILKSRFYSKENVDVKCFCRLYGGGHFEKISWKLSLCIE